MCFCLLFFQNDECDNNGGISVYNICIVLLNMLIGQVSDTFQKFQQDEQREYEVNRASIVMRMEQTSLCFCKVIYSL